MKNNWRQFGMELHLADSVQNYSPACVGVIAVVCVCPYVERLQVYNARVDVGIRASAGYPSGVDLAT